MNARPDPDALTAIVTVCGEMFGADGISESDNFFMLGGTSLNVVELTEDLLSRYGFELSLDAVFTSGTLGEMAKHCQPSQPTGR
jgi:acyl carrier protein